MREERKIHAVKMYPIIVGNFDRCHIICVKINDRLYMAAHDPCKVHGKTDQGDDTAGEPRTPAVNKHGLVLASAIQKHGESQHDNRKYQLDKI